MSTKIEWTDETWNPVRGCSIVSKGCTHCYAMRQAHRFSGPGQPYEGLTTMSKGGPVWTGKVRLVPELLDAPLRWTKPRRVFVNSMSDLFHEDVPHEFIARLFATMMEARQHTFQILTKRPERMLATMKQFVDENDEFGGELPDDVPPRNVWLGVSVEDQASADERIALLLQTPAAVRWISAEPLLGPIPNMDVHLVVRRYRDGRYYASEDGPDGGMLTRLHWIVAGGESGPRARPSHPDWFRSLRDQCAAAGVPFFFKQWGEWAPNCLCDSRTAHRDIKRPEPGKLGCMFHCGKRAAGRLLDGRTHDEYPA